jgi:hypothetical protein
MADIVCPHCKGTGVNYVIATTDGKPTLQPVTCVVCNGRGMIEAPAPPEPAKPVAPEAELWPILVPLGIFFLFFAFLLM